MTEEKINYKKKLKALHNVSDIKLTEKELEVLYYVYFKTYNTKESCEIILCEGENKFGISLDETRKTIIHLGSNNLDFMNGRFGYKDHGKTKIWDGNVNSKGIQLIRAIEDDINKRWYFKWERQIKAHKRVIITIVVIVIIIVYLISGCKIIDGFSAIDCTKTLIQK